MSNDNANMKTGKIILGTYLKNSKNKSLEHNGDKVTQRNTCQLFLPIVRRFEFGTVLIIKETSFIVEMSKTTYNYSFLKES
ncbi:MAG: hypothetical protein PVI90_04095 [Desulfobacteraceae bacterium]|jgi:hypothetical protein